MFATSTRSRRAAVGVAGLLLGAGVLAACSAGTPAPSASSPSASSSTPGPGAGGSAAGGSAVDPNAPESAPPGDIPDNQAFVPFSPPRGGFTVKVPEGWARTQDAAGTTTFTDKLNSITIDVAGAAKAPTEASVMTDVVPRLSSSRSGFTGGETTSVDRPAGTAVLTTYQADAPADPVTGKVVKDDVERYAFYHNGTEVVLTLAGPHGADNVDPWRTVTESMAWS